MVPSQNQRQKLSFRRGGMDAESADDSDGDGASFMVLGLELQLWIFCPRSFSKLG